MPPHRLFPVPGAAVATTIHGSGPPIALVHGGTGTAAFDWEFVIEPLAQSHTVVAMDMRAHGYSPIADGRIGTSRCGLDVATVMHRLGFPSFVAMGFSMGANACVQLAAVQPWRVTHLVTVGASVESFPERVDEILTGPWPRELRELPHPASDKGGEHWKWLRAQLAQDWVDNVAFDPEFLRRIEAPVLAIHGADDVITDPAQARKLVAGVRNGRAEFVANAGHAVQRDQPEEFLRLVGEFLGSLRSPM